MRAQALLLAALALALAATAAAATDRLRLRRARCPPEGFQTLPNFNVTAFIEQRWYSLHQEPLVYQPRSSLYCVAAKYEPLNPSNPLEGLKVFNYANKGEVNGNATGTSGADAPFPLLATIPDPAVPSKLRVGFGFPPSNRQIAALTGPYWVVDCGVSANPAQRSGNLYDWCIVTGGAPRTPHGTGCATGPHSQLLRLFTKSGVGLWLFSRFPVDTANTQVMLERAAQLGLDTSRLVAVQQQGCAYAGLLGK